MNDADRALCLDTLRVLSNPEGINQYSHGGSKPIDENHDIYKGGQPEVVNNVREPHHVVNNRGQTISTHHTSHLAQQAAQKYANNTGERHAVIHTKSDKLISEHFTDVVGFLNRK